MRTAFFGGRNFVATLIQKIQRSPLVAVSGINAILILLSVGLSLLVVRVLAKAEYGHLVYFYAGFGLLRVLMNLGLGIAMSRDIAASSHQPDKLREVVYSTIMIRVVSIGGYLGLLWVLALTTDQPYLGYIAVGGVAASLADMIFSVITGLRLIRAVGWMTAVQPVTYAVLTLGLVLTERVSSEFLMLAYIVSFAGMTALGVYFVVKSGRIAPPTRNSFKVSYVKPFLSFAIPVYSTTLALQVWNSICAGTLGTQGDFQTSAEFGVVFNLVGLVISITASSVVTTFYPQVSHLFSQQKTDLLVNYVAGTVKLLAQGYVFVAIVLFAFSVTIVDILFGDAYRSSASYLTTIAPAVLTLGLTPIFTFVLVGIGRPWSSLIGVCGQLVALWLLVFALPGTITPEKLSGAAVFSSLIGLITSASFCIRKLTWAVLPKRLWATLAVGVLSACLLWAIEGQIGMSLSVWHVVVGVIFTFFYWLPIVAQRLQR